MCPHLCYICHVFSQDALFLPHKANGEQWRLALRRRASCTAMTPGECCSWLPGQFRSPSSGFRLAYCDNLSFYCRKRLLTGIDKVVDAVAATVGPRGRNVVLEQSFGVPQVINDGVSIARAIDLEDPVENAGAQLVKEVAGRTNDAAGDGTTTASILARAMARAGVQAVASGANAMVVKKGIEKACNAAVAKLKELAKPISGRADIKNVASISAGNDDTVGEMIADALDKVGMILRIHDSDLGTTGGRPRISRRSSA